MTLRKRAHLLLKVLAVVVLLVLLKTAIHHFGYEFIALNDLVPSLIAGAIFIVGFLLSHVLHDYKEAERLSGEMRVALEAIRDEAHFFATATPAAQAHTRELEKLLSDIVTTLENCLGVTDRHCNLKAVLDLADAIPRVYDAFARLGISERYLVRLKYEHDILRRCLFRIYYMQRIQFVPSVHILVQTLVFASLGVLLFLESESAVEPVLIFGFVSYLFIYVLFLSQALEQPFRKGRGSLDDVSLFLLREFREKIDAPK